MDKVDKEEKSDPCVYEKEKEEIGMGFLRKLTKGVIDTALVPIEVIKDVATVGGLSTDQNEPYTTKRIKKALEDFKNAYNELDD